MIASGRRRPIVLALLAVVVLGIGVVLVARPGVDDRSPSPRRYAAARGAALRSLQQRLIPSSVGGWVAATPAEDGAVDVWLKAAALSARPSGAYEEALAEAERLLADPSTAPSVDVALAQTLPGPDGTDAAVVRRVTRALLDRARAGLQANDPRALTVLLQLSAGRSAAADDATRLLGDRVGPVACDRLPSAGEPLPDPSGSLTVVLRVLAAPGRHCPRAADLLAATLASPAWATWVSVGEQRDLALLAGTLPVELDDRLRRRLRSLLVVGPDAAIDVGTAVAVQSARRSLDLGGSLPAALGAHLGGQVTSHGGLPGRSTSPPTVFDVAILRQLVAAHLVAPDQLDATLRSSAGVAPVVDGTEVDPVVAGVLGSGDQPSCADVPSADERPARVTFESEVAEAIWAVTRQVCRDDLDAPALVRAARKEAEPAIRAVRLAGTILGTCQLERDAVTDQLATRVPARGSFATDSVIVWARSVAADPVGSCDAAWATA